MEAVSGRVASPLSLSPTHVPPKLFRRQIAVPAHNSPRHRLDSYLLCPSTENGRRRQGRRIICAARKKKGSKWEGEGYGPIPGENEFFYPEAVLLKKSQADDRDQPEFQDAEDEKRLEFLNLQMESAVKLERMRHYEVVYLIHEDHFQEVGPVTEKVQDFIREKKGRIWRLNDWGMRKLAYKIKKAKNANYILMNFEIEAQHINGFKNMLDGDERIIRHLVIKRDEAITEDCPPPPMFQFNTSDDEDEDDDVYDDDGEYDDDGDVEMEMDDYEGLEEVGENIFIVGEDEEEDGVAKEENRQIKSKKRMGASSR